MKSFYLCAALSVFYLVPTVYGKDCFLVKENTNVLKKEGQCEIAYAPHSTFKIALSLMGFDSGILESPTSPSFPFKPEYAPGINVCKGDHNAKTWMR
ncbi:MAG TPA: penicillin-binding transpeptidase domain-containing protein, partial [Bacteriovoracaceae bacterium]|nr:penicillin-binding transpeptidase domain-containing protein [Bacteriovoracaceae bacterium]